MYYYHWNEESGLEEIGVVSRKPLQGLTACTEEQAAQAKRLVYASHRPGAGKASYCIHHPGYFADAAEDLWCLDEHQLQQFSDEMDDVPAWLMARAQAGQVQGVDAAQLDAVLQTGVLSALQHSQQKKTVHILAMGDVGGTLLIGLALLGEDCIEQIGIYDFNEKLCQRWEHEINQIAYPWAYDRLPRVQVLEQSQLFHCDVFVFCASKSIPPVGGEVQDVRMAQLEANRAIISQYGQMARAANFQGLFAVVSDPVDPLCQTVWAASNCDADGNWDGGGLRPEQVQGYGLGVMNSRAAYFARQDQRFARFLTEGRAYGPHGQKLVIADSIAHYDHEASLELTRKTVEANLEVRGLGYKPYIAPALSSAAISILLTLRGEWHYSSNFLGGIYMGAKNRTTQYGVELEYLPLPQQLLERLQAVVDELHELAKRQVV